MYMLRRSKSYGGAILISTKQLTDYENWEVIPKDRLLCINNGEIEILSSPLVF
jgi:predicted glutamine amidotransferase